jgi:hypothetical protein
LGGWERIRRGRLWWLLLLLTGVAHEDVLFGWGSWCSFGLGLGRDVGVLVVTHDNVAFVVAVLFRVVRSDRSICHPVVFAIVLLA